MAFECYEKGLLTREHTDGLELTWGNAEAGIELLNKMIRKEGIGAILEKGTKEAARILSEKIGKDFSPFRTDFKGAPAIAHDYRWSWIKTLNQTVSSFAYSGQGSAYDYVADPEMGVSKKLNLFDNVSAADMVRLAMIRRDFEDCTGLCLFNLTGVSNVIDLQVKMISTVVGWDFNRDEALQLGERIVNLARLFNLRRGLTPEDDLDIGSRQIDAPSAGAGKGHSVRPHLKQMVEDYYGAMGWDRATGNPNKSTLKKLGLGELAI